MQAKRRPLQMTGFQKLISYWILRKSGSHTNILTFVSIVKGSNATSGLRRKFGTGPTEPMRTKYSQQRVEPPVFQSLINHLYDAQKVGNKNIKNMLKFLAQEAWYQHQQLCFTALKPWNWPEWETTVAQARAEWAKQQ